MFNVATELEPFFPHHAKAIRDEMTQWILNDDGEWSSSPRKMTDTRWNRVGDIICSLASLPGMFLTDDAKWARVRALCVAEAPRAMARHCFGGPRSYGCLDLAAWIMTDRITERAQEDTPPVTP